MGSANTNTLSEGGRRRRSRFGCRNCKLRKTKCDEGKPQCQKCVSFGILCNFMGNIPDLQPAAAETGRRWTHRGKAQIQPPISDGVWVCGETSSFKLNARCQDLINRHLGLSLTTPGDCNMMKVNRKLLELAFAHPFLMHSSLAVAFTYDRYLRNPQSCLRTVEECFHWSQGTTLLSKRLKEPLTPADRDAIWGAATALAVLTFSSPDASTPEQAWPLKSNNHSDLDWLRMTRSKMALWHTVNPLRHDSIFRVMATSYALMYAPFPDIGIGSMPCAMAAVCQLGDSSTADSSPYFYAAHAVSEILDLPSSEISTGHTQRFTLSINGAFKSLLLKKDPTALLLLYLWYCKAGRSIWWIGRRARVECPAIYQYIRTYPKVIAAIQTLFPEETFSDLQS